MSFVRGVYVVAIGVLLVLLVIFGIQSFYPAPGYLDSINRATHRMNVFFIVLPLGAFLAVVGTFVRRRLGIFGAGLILGGMGTMMYAVTPFSLDSLLRFVGIAVALAVLAFVGYKVLPSLRRA
jgi:hypothetical protein